MKRNRCLLGGALCLLLVFFFVSDGALSDEMLSDEKPARVSDYIQVLADFEQKKIYLLKEMYLLQGNENGTYGYVIDISPEESLKQKRKLIPKENCFVDLREGDLNYLGANYDDNGDLLYTDVRMGKEEMEQLFRRFAQSLE